MNSYILAVFALLAVLSVTYAGEELKAIKELYCSDDVETREKVNVCLESLPEKVHQAKVICMEEASPGVTDHEEFRKLACDEETGIAEKMHACMDRLKAEHKDKISKEDMQQILTVVSCVTELIS